MKRTGAFFCLCAAALIIGCGDKGNPTGNTPLTEADAIGKWVFNTVHMTYTIRMQMTNPPLDTSETMDTTATFTNNDDFAELKSDKSYLVSIKDPALDTTTETGTWSISGNTLIMIATGNMDTTTINMSVAGSSATMSMTESSSETEPSTGITYTMTGTTTITATKQ